MRILFDYATFVGQSHGGVSRVLYELARHVAEVPGVECRIFAGFHRNAYLADAPPGVKKRMIGFRLPSRMVKQRIFLPINRVLFGVYARLFKPDVCHLTYYDLPPVPPECKRVITIHDMMPELFPDGFLKNDPHRKWKRRALDWCHGVVCVSENTRKDLTRFYALGSKKTTVIHHGNSLADMIPAAIDEEHPYWLYVGTRAVEYKNFTLVLNALSRNGGDSHLVCFGGGQFSEDECQLIHTMGLAGRVHQRSGNDQVLAGYYAAAQGLVYPSRYEGFGLPPIEAMALGCPVLASNAPPMPEIIGDAGLFFSPDNPGELSLRMDELADITVRERLMCAGRLRARNYTWEKAAAEAVAFYHQLVEAADPDV